MAKIEMRCETAGCVTAIAKYGEHYHGVHSVEQAPAHQPSATAMCERCGGYHDGIKWSHVCKLCLVTVNAGELTGFFVPHRCAACDVKLVAAEKAAGRVCRRCNSVLSYCCC